MMKKSIFALSCILMLLSGCIYPYSPIPDAASSDRIVISGDIMIGELTRIRLGNVIGLGESPSLLDRDFPSGTVRVENDRGDIYDGTHEGRGVYVLDTSSAPEDALYRLCVRLDDGREYETPWTGVQQAPDIIQLDYRSDDTDVLLFIGMDGADSLRNFRWDYTETWEFHADFIPELMFVEGLSGRDAEDPSKIYRKRLEEEDYYFCWNSYDSVEPGFASTKGQSASRFSDNNFRSIKRSDKRMMVLYSILVTACGLSDDAYAYQTHMQSVSNSTGSLFEPLPSEMTGNIRCITDPSAPAIGYVDAVRRTSRRIYISGQYRSGYDAELDLYHPEADEDGNYNFNNIFAFDSPVYAEGDVPSRTNVLWAPKRCTDCRWAGGHKNKPEWWPNDDK